MSEQVRMVALSRLRESADNPRKHFGDLTEMAKSIQAQGLIEPIIARQADGGLEIVAGHRRARAAKLAGLKEVSVIVRELGRQEALETAIVENTERESLNALETAEGYAKLMSDFGLNADQVAERVGAKRSTVYQAVGLLDLAEPVKRALTSGKISASHALEIGKVRTSERIQLQALGDVLKMSSHGEKPSVRAVRRLIEKKYLAAASRHGNSKAKREVKEHGVDVALRRRVVARLQRRIAEAVERRAQLDENDLRTVILALAETQGETAREVFQRRGMRVDRLGKVGGAQLRSLVVELAIAPWLSLDEDGEYSDPVRATAKAYGLPLSELAANVEAEGAAEALFEKR
jgi:ParB/RepB/Spo0J family partition protein